MAGNEPEHDPNTGLEPRPAGAPEPSPAGAGEPEAHRVGPEPDHSLGEVARARRRRTAKAVGALVVFIVLVLFIVANSQPVEVNFLFLTAHPRLIWVMVTCAVLGGVLGYLLGRPGHEGKAKKRKDGSAPAGP